MGKFDYRRYSNHMEQLRLMEDLFKKAMDFVREKKGEDTIALGKNLGYGDFRISYAFRGIRSLSNDVKGWEGIPSLGDYLMAFKAGKKVNLDDPLSTIPAVSRLASSQRMEATLPKTTKKGQLEVSMYDEGQRIAVLWPEGYCTNEPDLALRIGGEIYGMQMAVKG
jgi:hypothetical protein